MSDIYEQHDRAFGNVSAFVIAKDGERVATIAFKRGGAVTAYVHWLGLEMTKGRAGGGGYDRASAACRSAAEKITPEGEWTHDSTPELRKAFVAALVAGERGTGWDRALRDAGFQVWGAL